MRRNSNKKGFTIVELVIVIAVIAILAGVMIPTFSSLVTKANESKALQEATNAYKVAMADALLDGNGEVTATSIEDDNYTFTLTDGVLTAVTEKGTAKYSYVVTNGVITSATKN